MRQTTKVVVFPDLQNTMTRYFFTFPIILTYINLAVSKELITFARKFLKDEENTYR